MTNKVDIFHFDIEMATNSLMELCAYMQHNHFDILWDFKGPSTCGLELLAQF